MTSAAIYTALGQFLDGDGGDVRGAVNTEQSNLLAAGSVTFCRAPGGTQPRRLNPPRVGIEIVPRGSWPSKQIGIGFELLDFIFDLECSVLRKDLPTGKSVLSVADSMARALVRRYRAVSNLIITVTGASFVRSWAELINLDQAPESTESVRAVVRVTFTFMEAQAANA